MFDKAKKGLAWWPVDLQEYTEGGELVTLRLMLLFKPQTRQAMKDRRVAMLKRTREKIAQMSVDGAQEPAAPESDAAPQDIGTRSIDQVLQKIEEGFAADESDVQLVIESTHGWNAKNGDEAVPFERAYLRNLIDEDPVFAKAVIAAYADCCEGVIRKNSEPGHAGNPAATRA